MIWLILFGLTIGFLLGALAVAFFVMVADVSSVRRGGMMDMTGMQHQAGWATNQADGTWKRVDRSVS